MMEDIIKGYELRERIGSGGFGVVHRAYQSTVGREVAIKIILPHFANHPDFIRRFENEAQVIARLEHPYIVPLYDYWRDPDGAYLVMRWLRGGNLRDALKQGPLDLEDCARLLDQITSALALAHRNSVIHRDLKPANILLDEDGNVYISDFGIAKDVREAAKSQTGTDVILGSPDYLAPEQARGDPVDPRTDIYSLGVVLYEVLTGQHPFPNKTSVERMYHHLNDPVPAITNLPDDVSGGINAIIQKATAKNPTHRYDDVLEMSAEFRQETELGFTPAGESLVEQLTLREQEILQFIIDGCTNQEIAQKLFITVSTVKWHAWQLYRKLHVRSRVQAIARTRELNLLVPDTPERSDTEVTYVRRPEPENPYKGLRAFQVVDARDFFGRENLTQCLIARLGEKTPDSRFLAVVGPSGSGKSSVVKAGLIPALWRGDLPGSDRWFVVELVPGTRPLDELEVALTRVAANQADHLREHLERDEYGLLRTAGLILPDDGSELVIIIDQFEELFTLVTSEDDRLRFLHLIQAAVTDPHSRVRVIITLRADFYDRPLHYPEFGLLVRNRLETVLPLSADELEAAITKPAERVGVSFEPGLVASITAEVYYQPGVLPLLQYTLTELFEQRERRTLTTAAYKYLGGTVGALAKRAEEIFDEQDKAGRTAIRQMFLRLVSIDERAEETKRRVHRAELLSITTAEDVMDEVIETYAAYRLLTLDHDPISRRPTVEMAHEAILHEWTRLRIWLDESRHDIRQQRLLAAAADEWQGAGKDLSFLLHGARLEQFEAWAEETELALTLSERDFLRTSLEYRSREEEIEHERQQHELRLTQQAAEAARQAETSQRRAANRLRYLVAGLGVFLIVAFILSAFALSTRSMAETQRDRAKAEAMVKSSLVLAQKAEKAYLRGETDLALAFALQAVDMESPPYESVLTYRDVALGHGTRAVFREHVNAVEDVAISPDGKYALSGGCMDMPCSSSEIILMNLEENRVVYRREAHDGPLLALAFSPDGSVALSGGVNGEILLWDVQDGTILHQYEARSGIQDLAFTPAKTDENARSFVSASTDGRLTLWDLETGDILRVFGPDNPDTPDIEGHTAAVNAIDFHPDGSQLVSASEDMTLILWDFDTGSIIHHMQGHTMSVLAVKFVPDGHIILSGSSDVTIRQWDPATGEEITPFDAPVLGTVYCLETMPDNETVLACREADIRFWNLSQWEETYSLKDGLATDDGVLLSLDLSADGQRLIAGTSSGTVRVWNLERTKELRRFKTDGTVLGTVDISDDGRTLLTGTQDYCGGILWDVATGTEIKRFASEGGEGLWSMGATLFEVEGQQRAIIACSNIDNGEVVTTWLSIWDIESGTELQRLTDHLSDVWQIDSTSDGQTAISSSIWDGEFFVWNLQTYELVNRLETGTPFIWDIDLSADGKRALVCQTNFETADVVLWNLVTGTVIDSYYLSEIGLCAVAFGPGESTAIVAPNDARIIKLDLETHEIMWQAYLDNLASSVLLSLNDAYVLVREMNVGTLSIWDAETGELIQYFGDHHGTPPNIAFSHDSQSFFSTGLDGTLIEWRITDLSEESLREWITNNRYIREFTCRERAQYHIEPLCE
jgi:WD40 repeat protein/serine/threonine protein kinase